MMKSYKLIAVVAIVAMASCAPCRKKAQLSQRDSIRVEIVERKIIIRDTVTVEIPHIEQSITIRGDTSILKNQYSLSSAILLPTGELNHSLETIPQKIKKPLATPIEVKDSIIYRERVLTQIVESERKLTTWQQFCINGFYLLFVLIVIILLF